MGSVTNDVIYIHRAQDTITHGEELVDQVLALSIARLSREPRLHHGQILTPADRSLREKESCTCFPVLASAFIEGWAR
jgi:hypothetical protein